MLQKIVDFQQDMQAHWVAVLQCGHTQHVRHRPPWINRPWVVEASGRAAALGALLDCLKCDRAEPADCPVSRP